MKTLFQRVFGLVFCLSMILVQPGFARSPVQPSSSPLLVPDDGYWDDRFGALGTDGIVRTVANSGGAVFAGGFFTKAGSISATDVARWYGSGWSTLGSGISSGDVNRIAVSGDDVYVGGAYDLTGGVHPTLFAKWNTTTSTWTAMGDGLDGYVYAIAASGVDLYIGGEFTHASGNTVNHIAKWDSTTNQWEALGSGVDGPVTAIAINGSNIFVGGRFLTAGGQSSMGVGKWDGTTWSMPGSGLDGAVSAIVVSGGDVYVGGGFTSAGGQPANNIAQWNESTQSWSALGTGVDGSVRAIAVSGNDVYVGGYFTIAGGSAANHIANWNASTNSWLPLGSGVNDTVWDIAIGSLGDVYLGGEFTAAGGKSSTYIARWNHSAGTPTPTMTATPTATPTLTATATATSTPLPIQTFEDNSAFVQYDGWRGVRDAGANGGTYRVSKAQGDKVTFRFTGPSVKWITRKGPDQGRAVVTIDGLTKCTCDLYSASVQPNAPLNFSSGSSATHTLVVRVLGSKNAASGDTIVAVDAFVVGTMIVQDDSPKVQYNNWKGNSIKGSSGGTFRSNGTAGAVARFTFAGTRVEWLTAKGPGYGKANVFIDGANEGTYDLYRPTQQWQVAIPFAGLSTGRHTLEIRPLGTKAVVVDAFRGRITPIAGAGAEGDSNWLFIILPPGLIALWMARPRG